MKWLYLVMMLLLLPTFALASETNQTEELVIHYFYRTGCPYCAQQEAFFNELLREYPDIEIIKYDIT
jgi:thiol-disulfide isomerase/thioredoxin